MTHTQEPTMPDTTAASPLSEERVREYEQMLAAVTPGPWALGNKTGVTFFCGHEAIIAHPADSRRRILLQFNFNFPYEADARFVAASPTIVAALLADRTALTARLEAVERAHEELFAERGRLREALFTISREFQFSADWNSRCDDAMRSALLPLGSESRS